MDLVVGAPHFFERKEEIGGAAYVYVNPAGHWDAAAPLRLNGTRGSMFGVALGAAGDLNQDGFEGEGRWGGRGDPRVLLRVPPPPPHRLSPPPTDLAVGAPFDGAGKVYIYHGSNLGIVAKPAQVKDGGRGRGGVGGKFPVASRCRFPASQLSLSPGPGRGGRGGDGLRVRALGGAGCGWEPLPRPARRLPL